MEGDLIGQVGIPSQLSKVMDDSDQRILSRKWEIYVFVSDYRHKDCRLLRRSIIPEYGVFAITRSQFGKRTLIGFSGCHFLCTS